MPTLITTPGASNANSYASLTEANTFLTEGRLYADVWQAAGQTNQEVALIWATALLDTAMDWYGSINDQSQALRWPRTGVIDLDGRIVTQTAIPESIKRITAELALELLRQDRSALPDLIGKGFSEASLGPLSVKVDKAAVLQLIPDWLLAQLTGVYGELRGDVKQGAGARMIRTVRT